MKRAQKGQQSRHGAKRLIVSGGLAVVVRIHTEMLFPESYSKSGSFVFLVNSTQCGVLDIGLDMINLYKYH